MNTVTYTSQDGIAEISINRPEKFNIITHQVVTDLNAAWQRFENSMTDRVAILSGSGELAFSAGADLKDLPHDLWRAIPGVGVHVSKPIIAATAGLVVGGALVLVQMADLAIAADNTRFSYPEAKVGYSGGLISSLAARIPHKIAMELLLLGETIDAKRAYEAGLVNKVVPVAKLREASREMAEQIASNAPLVLGMLKEYVAYVIPKGPSESAAIARARTESVNNAHDFKEGITAFLEKRVPQFSGH